MAFFLVKWRSFWQFWNIKHSFNLTSDMKRSSQIMPKKIFYGDDVIDDVTGWPQSFSLYSCLGEVYSGSKLQGQCLVNKCQYHNCLSRLYMPKTDLNELHFSRLQVKGQHHRLTGWPWHWKAILQIISNTIIFEIVTASIMSSCDFENSQISAQDTL